METTTPFTDAHYILPPPSPSSELGFVELLGLQDFQGLSSLLDVPSADDDSNNKACSGFLECSSEVLNQAPTTPNSSISSASNEEHNFLKEENEEEPEPDRDEDQKKTKKELKPKKPSQKKNKKKEPRVAFMTKSQVDHLEDGYKWRKYGQKAVKNSPFPRSYYRCTTASCNVKKRVERCFTDPSIVITTYEGQHVHPSPFSFFTNNARFTAIPETFNLPFQMGLGYNIGNYNGNAYLPSLDVSQISMASSTITGFSNPPSLARDNGLLQDILMMPCNMRPNEDRD